MTTPADEIRTAAAKWRRTHPDDDVAHALADLLDRWAWLGSIEADLLNRVGGPEALRIARLINQEQQ